MKTHIVQVITELEPAGAERVLADLSLELKKRNYAVSVVSLQSEPEVKTILNILRAENIPVYCLNVTKLTPWRIFRLRKIIKDIKRNNVSSPLIVHSHLMHANLACRIVKISDFKFPLINTVHIAEKRGSHFLFFLMDKLSYRFCDICTAVSKSAAKWHALKLGISPDSIKITYNGINFPKKISIENRKTLLKSWGLEKCKKLIGSVGRLDYQKGYDLFFKILPDLSKKIPENEIWGVVILGEGKQRSTLEAIEKTVPPNIKVIMPGYREDAAECIGAFDLFVMPSRYEGFSLTLIEAASSGIPLLISDEADAMEEIVKYAKNWQKTNFTNITKTTEKLIELLRKAPEDNDICNLSVAKMTDAYLNIYNSLLLLPQKY
ncbi:MAG TPA: hypothetical protein DD381_03770 [Lentisphaeria bacterium]|nr:MAG: hypothetical protein A2X47_06860 [Lentisphaerae bacterium GWF2_38_69]HBM15450.1 hypothetical protein [Lentisphaeria bacterium]